ncbi:MAG: lactonase family protein [Actinomycetota bacterium]|nr:lactonase family protein [Actinomycetota bacterium]
MRRLTRLAHVLVVATAFAGLTAWLTGAAAAEGNAGAVYTSTNQASGNAVAVFERAADGGLTAAGTYATGGLGTGGGLGNQSALALSDGGRSLFVVNAGSNDVTAFRVKSGGLTLVDRIGSGGVSPISLTTEGDLLYVLNAGAAGSAGNISGFRVGSDGALDAIAGSTRPLSAPSVGPAQIQFDPSGDTLVVTEKATNSIDTYVVGSNGIAGGPNVEASSGQTPFGFAFDKRGRVIVSEAFGGAASALSSYELGDEGGLSVISPSVAAGQERASCWVVTTGKFAYTTNTGTGSISGFAIGHDGSLSLLNARAGVTGGAPIDAALSRNDRFLYALNASTRRIDAFRIEADGSLIALAGAEAGALPAGVNGLVAT